MYVSGKLGRTLPCTYTFRSVEHFNFYSLTTVYSYIIISIIQCPQTNMVFFFFSFSWSGRVVRTGEKGIEALWGLVATGALGGQQ